MSTKQSGRQPGGRGAGIAAAGVVPHRRPGRSSIRHQPSGLRAGRRARAHVSALGARRLGAAPDRPDPVELLEEQARDAGARARADPVRADAGVAVHASSAARRVMARTSRTAADRADRSALAAMRTSPTSASSQRRTGAWSSASTTSTRRCRGRSSGTSSGWSRASRWPDGSAASTRSSAARSTSPPSARTVWRCATSPACARSTSGTRGWKSTRSAALLDAR